MASAASNFHSSGNNRFNDEAAQWDANPFIHIQSQNAYTAIKSEIGQPALSKACVLEIGCGTGILTLLLAKDVKLIVAVDAAKGMVGVLQEKVKSEGVKNVMPICVLLMDAEDRSLPPATYLDIQDQVVSSVDRSSQAENGNTGPRMKFDLITSHLVLHHIPDLKTVLEVMLSCLKPGGRIALTDFENFGPQAKRFHPRRKMAGVERHGIEKSDMHRLLEEVGFVDVDVKVAWRNEKRVEKWEGEFDEVVQGEKGELMEFSYLICLGRRPG